MVNIRVLSALAAWTPLLAEVDFLPELVYPVIVIFEKLGPVREQMAIVSKYL